MMQAILNDFLLLFIAANLPQISQSYIEARSMPSMTGDGVYLRAREYLFLFTCNESSCQWTTLKEGLQSAKYGVMMPLPSDYTCSSMFSDWSFSNWQNWQLAKLAKLRSFQ